MRLPQAGQALHHKFPEILLDIDQRHRRFLLLFLLLVISRLILPTAADALLPFDRVITTMQILSWKKNWIRRLYWIRPKLPQFLRSWKYNEPLFSKLKKSLKRNAVSYFIWKEGMIFPALSSDTVAESTPRISWNWSSFSQTASIEEKNHSSFRQLSERFFGRSVITCMQKPINTELQIPIWPK